MDLMMRCAGGKKNTLTGLLTVARYAKPDEGELVDRDIKRINEGIDKSRSKYRQIGTSRIKTIREYLTARGIIE